MTLDQLEHLEKRVIEFTVKRRQLGAASYEAEEIRVLLETMDEVLRYLIEQYPRKK